MGWNSTNMLINMHDPTLREIQDHIVEKLRELANRARAARSTPGDCLLLLGCNQGRHRSPMIRHLTTRWMDENHGMEVDSSDIDNVHWSRHSDCTLARQCVECNLYRENATRQACVAWYKNEMDLAIEFATRATWATANDLAWLGFRDLSLEVIPASPPLPPIPDGLFHRVRDDSPPDPRSRSRGISGGVSLGRGDSRPPPGGRSATPGPRQKGKGKGEEQAMPPNLVNVGRWTRAQQAQTGGKGAARPVTLTPAPSQGPPPTSAPPPVRHAGTQDAPIQVDPTPGGAGRAQMVIDVDALEQPVDAGVDKASVIHSLNLLRQALVNNQLNEEQSRHLRLLSLSTRSQTVGLWDCGTQTPEYGPANVGAARQLPTNPYTTQGAQGSDSSRRNKMPSSAPAARQLGEASSTSAGDAVREVPVQTAPTARRQGARTPDTAATAAAAAPTPVSQTPAVAKAAAAVAPREGRSPPPPGGRGVQIPAAAVEVFNIAAGDSDPDPPRREAQAPGVVGPPGAGGDRVLRCLKG